MSGPRHTVHVRVNDAGTGQPTPVRIRFVDSDGNYLAPFGRVDQFATGVGEDVGGNVLLGGRQFAYIDGCCEIALPADPVQVEIHKGPEYKPLRTQTALGSGKLALRFAIERGFDLRHDLWYAGDIRSHFLTPHAALLEAAAEDLAVVNLLACEVGACGELASGRQIANILAFSGQQPALQMPGHLVVVNTLNSHPRLGQLLLLNCHRAVYPLTFGGPQGGENWSLADWCDQCHRKGGLVVWSDRFDQALYGEALADALLGRVDAFDPGEFDHQSLGMGVWYRLLNCGLRLPLAGGSWKHSNRQLLGSWRTYARLQDDEELSYGAWIEAVRAGRTFVTNGPFLTLTVNGQPPGSLLALHAETETVHVRAAARSPIPFERLELVQNGVALAGIEASGEPANASLDEDIAIRGSCWLAARCWGSVHEHASPDRTARVTAHTSAAYLQLGPQPLRAEPMQFGVLLEHLDASREWLIHNGRFDSDRQRAHLLGIFDQARAQLLGDRQEEMHLHQPEA